MAHSVLFSDNRLDSTHKLRSRYTDASSASSTARLPSPEQCLSPLRLTVPPLRLQQLLQLSTESLASSCGSLRSVLSEDRAFASPRVVRASHTLCLPTSPRREKHYKPRTTTVILRGRRVSANLLLDRPKV